MESIILSLYIISKTILYTLGRLKINITNELPRYFSLENSNLYRI